MPNPDARKIPNYFTFNKSGTINDRDLAQTIMQELKVEADETTGANFKLEIKPFGPIEGYTLYKLELA